MVTLVGECIDKASEVTQELSADIVSAFESIGESTHRCHYVLNCPMIVLEFNRWLHHEVDPFQRRLDLVLPNPSCNLLLY